MTGFASLKIMRLPSYLNQPENLLIDTKGELPMVKITDFGLAKIVGWSLFLIPLFLKFTLA